MWVADHPVQEYGIVLKPNHFAWAFWRLVRGMMGIAGSFARRLRRLWVKQWSCPRMGVAQHC
jgi:hypothetical protein